ncbi:hypothetical protein D3C87_1534860 [compost metagenome]
MGAGYISVVVSGDDGRVFRISDCVQPFPCQSGLDLGRKIDQITGNEELIGMAGLEIAQQKIECIDEQMLAPVSMPVDEAGDTPGHEFPNRQFRQRSQMDVGNMGEFEHGPDITHETEIRYEIYASGAESRWALPA